MQVSYADVRRAAFLNTEENFRSAIPPVPVTLTTIGREAISAWSRTWMGLHPSGHGAWNWARLIRRYHYNERNFHVALWVGDDLCGLAAGKVPHDHACLTLEYMARRQDSANPLAGEVTGIVSTAAVYYCKGLGIPRLELQNPAPGLVNRYLGFGFPLAYKRGLNHYLAMDIQ